MKILDIVTSPWAIKPDKLVEITGIYAAHMNGPKLDLSAYEAQHGKLENGEQGYEVINGVAVIPLQGVIAKKMNMFSRISGGVSTQLFNRDYMEAQNDPGVDSVIVYADTPGGTVDGTEDSGNLVYDMRNAKPTVTLANNLMASAGYWIGSASQKVYIENKTTEVGSIGVVTTHADYSKYYRERGVTIQEIYAGKFKRLASQYKPLSKEAKQYIQDQVDYLYAIFVETVAKHRGVSVQTVLDNMADGRLFTGQQAIDAGLVDGVSTLDALITSLSKGDYPDDQAGALVQGVDLEDESNELNEEIEMAGENQPVITKGYILENHADIAEEFRKEGAANVDTDKVAEEAATAERERIKSVMDQSMPGHEALINGLAFDGKTTGPEAAVQILQAEKGKKEKYKADLEADTGDLSGVQASVEGDAGSAGAALTQDEKWEKEFNQSADLQKEFRQASTYIAFKKAEPKKTQAA